jgi:hypothetical protein
MTLPKRSPIDTEETPIEERIQKALKHYRRCLGTKELAAFPHEKLRPSYDQVSDSALRIKRVASNLEVHENNPPTQRLILNSIKSVDGFDVILYL